MTGRTGKAAGNEGDMMDSEKRKKLRGTLTVEPQR